MAINKFTFYINNRFYLITYKLKGNIGLCNKIVFKLC